MSGTTGQENTLPIKSTMASTDYIRTVNGGISSRMLPADVGAQIASEVNNSINRAKYRFITGADAILSTDNVVACTGTFTVTMPSPALAYDSTTNISNVITIASKGTSTITINPFSSESFWDGSENASYNISGASVTFVTDGIDWIKTNS